MDHAGVEGLIAMHYGQQSLDLEKKKKVMKVGGGYVMWVLGVVGGKGEI